MNIIYYNENGLITGAATKMQPEEGRLYIESDIVPNFKLSSEYYVSDDFVIPRPDLSIGEIYDLTVNQEIVLTGIPANTEVFNNETFTGLADGTDIFLSFDTPGNYFLKFRPPFPYKEKTAHVSVT